MAEENEEELLGSDYVDTVNQLNQQATQMGGGFYQLARTTNFEEQYPNAINDFIKTEGVKKIADDAGVGVDSLSPPINIDDETISQMDSILRSADPLNMSQDELDLLRSNVNGIINKIDIPTTEEVSSFISAYNNFVLAARFENISFTTNIREIPLVSTDISIDNFIFRTNVRKLVVISLNKLVYPFITARYQIPSEQQATLTGVVTTKGDYSINYAGITKIQGSTNISAGSKVLISNNAKKLSVLEQQKNEVVWISEDTQTIQLKDPLLFDIGSNHVIEVYQYTSNNVLSPGELIKIPQ